MMRVNTAFTNAVWHSLQELYMRLWTKLVLHSHFKYLSVVRVAWSSKMSATRNYQGNHQSDTRIKLNKLGWISYVKKLLSVFKLFSFSFLHCFGGISSTDLFGSWHCHHIFINHSEAIHDPIVGSCNSLPTCNFVAKRLLTGDFFFYWFVEELQTQTLNDIITITWGLKLCFWLRMWWETFGWTTAGFLASDVFVNFHKHYV